MPTITKTTTPIWEQVDNIMENFNFTRVHETMVRLDWKWSTDKGLQVPSISDLKVTARRVLTGVDGISSFYLSTGGFVASVDRWGILNLSFEITNYAGN